MNSYEQQFLTSMQFQAAHFQEQMQSFKSFLAGPNDPCNVNYDALGEDAQPAQF
jgi:hypothetical protein